MSERVTTQHPAEPSTSPLFLRTKETNETNKQLPFKIKIQYPPVYFWRAEKAPPAAAAAVR